jgi:hypothetical protein
VNAYLAIAIVPAAVPVNFSGPRLFIDTIDPTTIGAIYRFKDVSQLREIYTRLGLRRCPNGYYNIKHNKVHGEEAMLITFEKVFLGVKKFELQMKYHISHNVISQIVEWFCDWIQRNWIYLIRQNTPYYAAPVGPNQLSQMEQSANKIRNKLIEVNYVYMCIQLYISMYIYIYIYMNRYIFKKISELLLEIQHSC